MAPRVFVRGVVPAVLMIAVAALTPAAGGVAAESEARDVVDVGPFVVARPAGTGWRAEKRETSIAWEKTSAGPPPCIGTFTHIDVERVAVPGEKWRLTDEEVAVDFRDLEEWQMLSKGVGAGSYALEDVVKGASMRGERQLYYMTYRTITPPHGSTLGRRVVQDAVLYLYFPPAFSNDHFFYQFHYNVGCAVPEDVTCAKQDTSSEILPIIDSLFIKPPPIGALRTSLVPDPASAAIVLYRPSSFVGMGVVPKVFVDEQKVADIYNGRYLVLEVAPGPHAVRSDKKDSVVNQVWEAGKVYFIRLTLEKFGWSMVARGQVSAVPEDQARKELEKLVPNDPAVE